MNTLILEIIASKKIIRQMPIILTSKKALLIICHIKMSYREQKKSLISIFQFPKDTCQASEKP